MTYLPFILTATKSGGGGHDSSMPSAVRKARLAAAQSNGILNKLISTDMINFCQSTMVISMIPVMQMHLLDSLSSDTMVQRVANSHLEICFLVLEELGKTWWGANYIHRFFSVFRQKLAQSQAAALLDPFSFSEQVPNRGEATTELDIGSYLGSWDFEQLWYSGQTGETLDEFNPLL